MVSCCNSIPARDLVDRWQLSRLRNFSCYWFHAPLTVLLPLNVLDKTLSAETRLMKDIHALLFEHFRATRLVVVDSGQRKRAKQREKKRKERRKQPNQESGKRRDKNAGHSFFSSLLNRRQPSVVVSLFQHALLIVCLIYFCLPTWTKTRSRHDSNSFSLF